MVYARSSAFRMYIGFLAVAIRKLVLPGGRKCAVVWTQAGLFGAYIRRRCGLNTELLDSALPPLAGGKTSCDNCVR
jgi:hypothetical protein